MNITSAQRSEICRLTEGKNYAALGDLLNTLEDTAETRVLRRLPRLFGTAEVLEEAKSFTALPNPIKRLNILKPFMISFALSASAIILLLIWGL